ncbi:MAG TPA: DUF3267 domain-containing protein [Candidatus Marinimicrobia bacterium]|nr:DUF3267 domain-containing protein [Candidatus Neomarinimicrobiota bacterium]
MCNLKTLTDIMQELEGYQTEKLTISLIWANVFGILIIIPTGIIFGLPYYFLWEPKIDIKQLIGNLGSQIAGRGFILVIIILIIGIVLHELIHGITWAIFTKQGFKSLKFGVVWKMLTPYCHCKEVLNVKQYRIGSILPAIILGIVPSIIAILTGNFGLLIFGMLFTVASGGDFLTINLIRKENSTDLVLDHPSEIGCFIYRKIEEKANHNNG